MNSSGTHIDDPFPNALHRAISPRVCKGRGPGEPDTLHLPFTKEGEVVHTR
jgi:hypothetical protein